MSQTLIQSYVWYGDACFFVSTINRESSAALAQGAVYAETMVWRYDYVERERGEFLGQAEGANGSIRMHLDVCRCIYESGRMDRGEEE
jgi:hypothetical protein